jgi:Uncharacterized conserved protein
MKKGLRDFLIILLCIVVVSIGLTGTLIKNHKGSWNFWEDKGDYHQEINKEKNIELEAAEEIYIDSKTAKITVFPEDRQDIKVNLSGTINSFLPITEPELNLNNDGKKVTITLSDNFKMLTGTNNIKLDIYIPKSFNKDVKIKNITGSVNIENITLNNLDIDTTTGKITLDKLSVNNFAASCTTGSIDINDADTKETKIRLTTGSAKIDNFSGNINVKGTTGGIDISYKKFDNDIDAVVTTGSIVLDLPEKSEFKLNAHTTTGKISCNFPLNIQENSKNNLIGTSGNSDNSINLDVTTGSIAIK